MSKFIINDIKLLNSWGYNLKTNTDCTICRCSLNTNSLYNQDKGIDSQIVSGICGHLFHEECIGPWINKNRNCPICFAVWKVKKINQ
jgi:RING-box protein 1